jgi:hypothetical protein
VARNASRNLAAGPSGNPTTGPATSFFRNFRVIGPSLSSGVRVEGEDPVVGRTVIQCAFEQDRGNLKGGLKGLAFDNAIYGVAALSIIS